MKTRAPEILPEYYLGLDAGGTRTRALLVARDGTVAGFGAGAAANPGNTSLPDAVRSITNAAAAAWKKTDLVTRLATTDMPRPRRASWAWRA